LCITDAKKLYKYDITAQEETKEFKIVDLPESIIPLKIVSRKIDCNVLTLLLVSNNGINQIWEKQNDENFSLKEYPTELFEFKDIFERFGFIFALTSDGQLYSWETKEWCKGIFGQEYTEDSEKIIYAEAFRNHTIRSIHLGHYMAVVCASPQGVEDEWDYYVISEYPTFETEKVENNLFKISDFHNMKFDFIEVGNKNVFAKLSKEHLAEDNSNSQDYKCSVTGQFPIKGVMHFYQNEKEEWQFLSEEGYQKVKEDLPEIVYATKFPIRGLDKWNPAKIKTDDLFEDTKDLEDYPKYIGKSVFNSINKKFPITNEKKLFEKSKFLNRPLIFYRVKRRIKKLSSLPYINLSHFIKRSSRQFVNLDVNPDYSLVFNKKVIDINKEKYTELIESHMKFTNALDDQILDAIGAFVGKGNIDLINNSQRRILSKL
jgi:hypothetical protein